MTSTVEERNMANEGSIADKFSDDEMEQIRRHGAAQMGDPSFSEEVEKELQKRHEASYAKMRAAQTGGSGMSGLGPPPMEQKQVQQQGAIQQQAATAGQAKATQAQAGQVPDMAPPAPTGSIGVTEPYQAERGQTPPGIPEKPPEAPGAPPA